MSEVESVRKAIDALTIQDIYLRESSLSVAEDFDPKLVEAAALTNLTWGPRRAAILEVEDNATKEKLNLWKVEFWGRCRYMKKIDPVPTEKYEPKANEITATIDAVFIAEYRLSDLTVPPEALQAFAQHNVAYHVWPFWREFIQSVGARALLPRLTLPMHVFKPPSPNPAVASEKK